MYWKIIKDNINKPPDKSEVGRFYKSVPVTGRLFKFRLLDDDRNVYFEGESNNCEDEVAFAPLDYFGLPGYGCTIIQYYNEDVKRWEDL